ncbi:MAG: Uma2 family endonuclease, partial [Tepidisphaeraceae bacterium]
RLDWEVMMSIAFEPMTTEQMLALPEDESVERELIAGELRERPMTKRNYPHSRIQANLCFVLKRWSQAQPEPRGAVVAGEAAIRLRRNPDTTVGVDVAYLSPQTVQANAKDARVVDGVPLLVVEILSPSDKHEEISAKVRTYLDAGVSLVLVVDPDLELITACRPGVPPESFNTTHELVGDPYLPGLRVLVAEIFSI